MKKERVEAWHFLGTVDGRLNLRHGKQGRIQVKPGQVLHETRPLVLCRNGLHASICVIDALQYAYSPCVSRVLLYGDIVHGSGKLCASYRKVLWMFDATDVLRRFAKDCALDVVRFWIPPQVVLDYLHSDTEELRDAARYAAWDAARDAARDAVWDAAQFAARDAARDAVWDAAQFAAWDAAQCAAWDAVWDAAQFAARDAVWDAARYAAWDAAQCPSWDAARSTQNARLEKALFAEHERLENMKFNKGDK
jgi:hypothetical protein